MTDSDATPMTSSSDASRTLIVMRHAKSAWDTDDADHDRPLAKRGWRDALVAGHVLREFADPIELVLCSTATRTRQTWDRAVEGGARATNVEYRSEIYEAESADLVGVLRAVPDELRSVLILGHVPGVEHLVSALAAHDEHPGWQEMAVKYPTSAMAVLEITSTWRELDPASARLRAYLVPRGEKPDSAH